MSLTIDEAKKLVVEFCATYPVASKIPYKLRNTQEEALDEPKATTEREGRILGAYFPGRGYAAFAVSNFRDADHFKGTLRHEILGHYGINTFKPGEKRAVLERLIESRSEPGIEAIWATVDRAYPALDEMRKAEEVYAFACEIIEPHNRANVAIGLRSFQEACIDRSRPMSYGDLMNLTTMVAEGMHDRSRSQQNFPASDDAQFKLENTPNTAEYPVWLAVPHDAREAVRLAAGKLESGQSAIGWDKEASLWFARPGADLDRVAQWLPDTSARPSGGDPEAEFLDALTQGGLLVKGMPVMDGQLHRVATVEDKKGKQNGAYRGFLDGRRPAGWFTNFKRSNDAVKWSATGGEVDPVARLHIRAAARQSQDDAQRARDQLYVQQTLAAKRFYDRLPGADPAHPYLVRKGIPPTPDLRQTRNGALVVPFFNASGTFKTLQYITPEGEKYLFKDAPKQGHFLVVGGSLTPDQPVLYAEGYATARSLNLATDLPVVMTIDAGNMVVVAKVLHERFPDSPHVFLADFDHAKDVNKGLQMATAAAEQVGGQVLYPVFTDEEKALGLTDFNDLHQSRGLDALRSQIAPVLVPDNEVPTMQEEKVAPDSATDSAVVDSVLPSAAPAPLTFTHNGEPATLDLERFQPQPQVEPPAAPAELELPVASAPLTFTHMGQPASLGVSLSVPEFSPEVAAELLDDQAKSGGGHSMADSSMPPVKTAQHVQLENQAGQALSLEVATLLAEDIAESGGGHSIMDSWVALKAEAERHGYVPHLDLPYDVSNLEIDYTDAQGGSTPIYTTLYPGGYVQTIYDGLQMHREISIDMADQTAAVRGSIEMDAEKKGAPTLLSFTHNGEPASLGLKPDPAIAPSPESLGAEWTAHQLEQLNARSATEQAVFAEVESLLKNHKFELKTQITELRHGHTGPDSEGVQDHKSTIRVIDQALKEMRQQRDYDGDPSNLSLLDRFKYDQVGDKQAITQGRGLDGSLRDEWVKQQLQQPGSPNRFEGVADARQFQAERTARAEALLSRVLVLGSKAEVTALVRDEISVRQAENSALEAPTVAEVKAPAQRRAEEQLSMALEPVLAPSTRAETVVAPIKPLVERQEIESDVESTTPDAALLAPAPSVQAPEQEAPLPTDDPVITSRPVDDAGNGTSPAGEHELDAILVGAPRPRGTEVEPQLSHMDLDALLARLERQVQGDTVLYKLDGEPAFVDQGNRLEMATGGGQSDEKIVAALLIAAQFYRGRIELTGSDAFKARAIDLIVQHQINVEMKTPVQRMLLDDARKAFSAEPVVPDAVAGDTPPAYGPIAPDQPDQPDQATPDPAAPPQPEKAVAEPRGIPAEVHQPAEKAKDGVVGKVMRFGTAPFQFDANNADTTYIRLRTKTGTQTFWGKELAGLLRDTRVQPGKMVTLQWLGKEPVVIKVPRKDEQGVTTHFEEKNTHRNQWTLTVKGDNTVRTGQDEGVKLAPYDAARFAVVQQTVIKRLGLDVPVPTPPVNGLYWMTPNGQGSAKAGDELSAQRPAIDPKNSAGQPVISSWSQDGHLDMFLVRGDGPYLQGVVRQGNEFQHVLVSLPGTQDAPPMVFNAITPEGLVPIGTGNAINRSGGVPVSRENIAFRLEGDTATRIGKLDAPAEIPPALHARLGFDERWKDDNALPKSAPTAAPAAQPSDPRPA